MSTYSVRKLLAKKELDFESSLFEFTRDHGLAGLEMWVSPLEHRDLDEAQPLGEIRDRMAEFELEMYAFCVESGLMTGLLAPEYHPRAEWLASVRKVNLDRAEYCRYWLDIAREVGVPNVRFCYGHGFYGYKVTASDVVAFNVDQARDLYAPLCAEAKADGIRVGFENHGFITSDQHFLEGVLAAVPDLHVCLDLGNLPDEKMPYIRHVAEHERVLYVHAKTHEFNADGEDTYVDFGAVMETLHQAGFDGWYSIEWEGPKLSDAEGVQKSQALLEKYAY